MLISSKMLRSRVAYVAMQKKLIYDPRLMWKVRKGYTFMFINTSRDQKWKTFLGKNVKIPKTLAGFSQIYFEKHVVTQMIV